MISDDDLALLTDLEESQPLTEERWRVLYERWRGRANTEALQLIGDLRGWRE